MLWWLSHRSTEWASDWINKATDWMWWCVWLTGHSQSPTPTVVTVQDQATKPFVACWRSWTVPWAACVVGKLFQQAGGHFATIILLLFPFHMPHYNTLQSLHKTHETFWDNLEFTADSDWALLVYFDISPEGYKCKKLLIWISNILVLILPHCYQGPLRPCKTLFYEIME